MISLDRSQCLLSSEYIDFHFCPTVGEWPPLSLATRFRAINCDLTLPEQLRPIISHRPPSFLQAEIPYCKEAFSHEHEPAMKAVPSLDGGR